MVAAAVASDSFLPGGFLLVEDVLQVFPFRLEYLSAWLDADEGKSLADTAAAADVVDQDIQARSVGLVVQPGSWH